MPWLCDVSQGRLPRGGGVKRCCVQGTAVPGQGVETHVWVYQPYLLQALSPACGRKGTTLHLEMTWKPVSVRELRASRLQTARRMARGGPSHSVAGVRVPWTAPMGVAGRCPLGWGRGRVSCSAGPLAPLRSLDQSSPPL